MKYKVIVEYEYPAEHKTPVKAELTLHGDRVETWNIKPITKNDLEVDCVDRQAAITFVCKNTKEILKDTKPLEVKLSDDYLYENVAKIMRNPKVLSSVTPLSSELEKNSKKLEKGTTKNDLGVDAISRAEMLRYQEYLHGKMSNEENHKLWEFIKDLPPITPQESIDYKAQYESFAKKSEIVISQLRADRDRLKDFLDKIRAEIGKSKTEHEMQLAENNTKDKLLISHIYCDIVHILDKYKAESEDKE